MPEYTIRGRQNYPNNKKYTPELTQAQGLQRGGEKMKIIKIMKKTKIAKSMKDTLQNKTMVKMTMKKVKNIKN